MRVILIDDEQLALNYLEYQLQTIGSVQVVGKFIDPQAGKECILREPVDAVFLDIEMPEINGIELAEQLLESNPRLMIVFATAYNQYAVEAFELNALDYVLKPIGAERLAKTMQRIQDRLQEPSADSAAAIQQIRLTMFKQVSMKFEDQEHISIRWRTAKAQELFLYLLQNRGQYVRKSALIDLLWPEYEPSKAYAQLYTAVYHIRKTLIPFGAYFELSNIADSYILYLDNMLLDVEEWDKMIRLGQPVSGDTIEDYERMMALYIGDYMQEAEYWWAESERHRLKLLWRRTAVQMAEWYISCGQPEKAMEKYAEICERCPQSEEAHLALMQMYASHNNRVAVHRQYRLLTDVLMKELNEQPSPYITEWYGNWNQEKKE